MKYLRIVLDIVYILVFVSPNTAQVTIYHAFLLTTKKCPQPQSEYEHFQQHALIIRTYQTEIHALTMLYYFTLAMLFL